MTSVLLRSLKCWRILKPVDYCFEMARKWQVLCPRQVTEVQVFLLLRQSLCH